MAVKASRINRINRSTQVRGPASPHFYGTPIRHRKLGTTPWLALADRLPGSFLFGFGGFGGFASHAFLGLLLLPLPALVIFAWCDSHFGAYLIVRRWSRALANLSRTGFPSSTSPGFPCRKAEPGILRPAGSERFFPCLPRRFRSGGPPVARGFFFRTFPEREHPAVVVRPGKHEFPLTEQFTATTLPMLAPFRAKNFDVAVPFPPGDRSARPRSSSPNPSTPRPSNI